MNPNDPAIPKPKISDVVWDEDTPPLQGGFAWVRFGTHANGRCAVKIMKSERGAAYLAAREFAALGLAAHPFTVQVWGYGEAEGHVYLIMEAMPGGALRDRAGDFRDPDRIARLGGQVAESLHVAHSRGVVHRDLTPTNILLGEEDVARVADFGIAKLPRESTLGIEGGTAGYKSPEQRLDLRNAGPASDIWSLGQVLHGLATGGELYEDRDDTGVYAATRVQGPLGLVLGKALAFRARDRYRDAGALASQLRNVAEGRPVSDPGPVERSVAVLRRLFRKRPAWATVAVLLAAIAGAVVWGVYQERNQARSRQEAEQAGREQALRERARMREDLRDRIGKRDFGPETADLATRVREAFPDDPMILADFLAIDLVRGSSKADYTANRAKVHDAVARDEHPLGPPEAFEAMMSRARVLHRLSADLVVPYPPNPAKAAPILAELEGLESALANVPVSARSDVLGWMVATCRQALKWIDTARDERWAEARDGLLAQVDAEPSVELFLAAAACQMASKPPSELRLEERPTELTLWMAERTTAITVRGLDPRVSPLNRSGRAYEMLAQAHCQMASLVARLDASYPPSEIVRTIDRLVGSLDNPLIEPEIRLIGRAKVLQILSLEFDESQVPLWQPAGTAAYRARVALLRDAIQRLLADWEADEPNLDADPIPWRQQDLAAKEALLTHFHSTLQGPDRKTPQAVSRDLRSHLTRAYEQWIRSEEGRVLPEGGP